jgi:hypothetical protein
MTSKPVDPYAAGMVQGPRDWPHVELEARFVAVLKDHRDGRGLQLIRPATRAIRRYEIHELILTNEADAGPGKTVNAASYIAFCEFITGGMLVEGDQVVINGQSIGEIAGFDETHMPNHQNIVIRGPKRLTGRELGAQLGDPIKFVSVWTKG